jgi:hypothetical protein
MATMEVVGLCWGRGVVTVELGQKVMARTRKGRLGRFGGGRQARRTTTKNLLRGVLELFSEAGSTENRLGGGHFLLTEAVTRNRLAKSINRCGYYKKNRLEK